MNNAEFDKDVLKKTTPHIVCPRCGYIDNSEYSGVSVFICPECSSGGIVYSNTEEN